MTRRGRKSGESVAHATMLLIEGSDENSLLNSHGIRYASTDFDFTNEDLFMRSDLLLAFGFASIVWASFSPSASARDWPAEYLAFGAVSVEQPVLLSKLLNVRTAVGRGGYGLNFEIEALIENRSADKEVAAVWTWNGWSTKLHCPLQYHDTLDNGYERWTGKCQQNGGFVTAADDVQLALVATMGGAEYWDNHRGANYRIINMASPVQGIELAMSDPLRTTAGGKAALLGFKIFPFAGVRKAAIVYSTDGWKTTRIHTVELQQGDNPALAYSTQLMLPTETETLDFALVLSVDGTEFWDNHGGWNYRLQL